MSGGRTHVTEVCSDHPCWPPGHVPRGPWLLYAQELHEAGHLVQVIFDGAGTLWAKMFEQPTHDFNPLDRAVKEALERAGLPVLNDNDGHPSLADRVKVGYKPIIL